MEEELAWILATGPGATAPAKPRVRTTSPGGGKKTAQGPPVARVNVVLPKELPGQLGLKKRGALGPRIPSAGAEADGAGARVRSRTPHHSCAGPVARAPPHPVVARARRLLVQPPPRPRGPRGVRPKGNAASARPPAAARYTHLVRMPLGPVSGATE